jgi:hypothetical protein
MRRTARAGTVPTVGVVFSGRDKACPDLCTGTSIKADKHAKNLIALLGLDSFMVLTPYQNVAGVRYIDFYIILVLNKIAFAEIFIREKLN